MGKRIVIKGADFSKNGMKSVNYVESIFCTTFQNELNGNKLPMVIAENINCKHTIKFEVELINNATTFDIIAGWYDYANESGPRRRLRLVKKYKVNSVDEETFILAQQWGVGVEVEGKTDVTPGSMNSHLVMVFLLTEKKCLEIITIEKIFHSKKFRYILAQ